MQIPLSDTTLLSKHPPIKKDIQLIHPVLRDANHRLILFTLKSFCDNDIRKYSPFKTLSKREILLTFGNNCAIWGPTKGFTGALKPIN